MRLQSILILPTAGKSHSVVFSFRSVSKNGTKESRYRQRILPFGNTVKAAGSFYVTRPSCADIPRLCADLFVFRRTSDFYCQGLIGLIGGQSAMGKHPDSRPWCVSGLVRLERPNESLHCCWHCVAIVALCCYILTNAIKSGWKMGLNFE